MKSEFLRQFRNLFREKKEKFNKKILIFLFFLIVSFLIWLLNALDKEYITEIQVPVLYTNFPGNKVQVTKLPENFKLRVEATGYLLLKHLLTSTLKPMHIDINEHVPEFRAVDTIDFYVRTSGFREQIESQLFKEIQIISIKPENIYFFFVNKKFRTVPVKPVISYNLGKQLVLKDEITFHPYKVIINGPVNIIDTIVNIETVNTDFGLVDRSIRKNVMLNVPANIGCSDKTTEITLKVEKYTESTIQVPVSVINNSGKPLQLIPDNVTISYCTSLSNYRTIQRSQFNVVVDYSEFFTKNVNKLTVIVKNSPPEAFNIRVYPKTIDFVIKK